MRPIIPTALLSILLGWPGDVQASPKVPQVVVAVVERSAVETVVTRPGEVTPEIRFPVAPRVTGRIERLLAHPGDHIASGEKLAVLSAPEIDQAFMRAEAELESARAELSGAESDLNVQETLIRTKVTTRNRLLEARIRLARSKAAVAVGQAVVAARKADRNELTVTAPMNLVVVARLRQQGDLVGPGLPILEAYSNSQPRFEFSIPVTLSSALRSGMEVQVIHQGSARNIVASLSRIVRAAEPVTRTVKIEIDLPPDSGFVAGDYGEVRIPVGVTHCLTVPKKAVISRAGVTGVFVVDDRGTARYRSVRTGSNHDHRVEILAGLQAGERVILSPLAELVDGVAVEIRAP